MRRGTAQTAVELKICGWRPRRRGVWQRQGTEGTARAMGGTAAAITIQELRWLDSKTAVSHGAPSTTGSICLRYMLPMATMSVETSSGASQIFDEKRDCVTILNDYKAADKNGFNENSMNEDPKEELAVDKQDLPMDFMDKLNIKGVTKVV